MKLNGLFNEYILKKKNKYHKKKVKRETNER
jgi:hypothetical protein